MKSYDIPIDFCPKCRNKHIIVVQSTMGERYYSLTGKCLYKSKYDDVKATFLKCRKCGWQSGAWGESGFENKEEYEDLEELYLKESERK